MRLKAAGHAAVAVSMLVILPLLLGTTDASLPKEVTIGALLTSHENGAVFVEAVNQLNGYDNSAGLPSPVHFNATYTLMDTNPLRAARAVCDEVISNQVYVVLAGSKSYSDLSAMAVSFTCGFYRIPTIGISVRDSVFSDKVSVLYFIISVCILRVVSRFVMSII